MTEAGASSLLFGLQKAANQFLFAIFSYLQIWSNMMDQKPYLAKIICGLHCITLH